MDDKDERDLGIERVEPSKKPDDPGKPKPNPLGDPVPPPPPPPPDPPSPPGQGGG